MATIFSESCYCVITGASRGLGREMAVQFAREWKKSATKSHIVLIARNRSGLEETQAILKSEDPEGVVTVSIISADLSELNTASSTSDRIMTDFSPDRHKQVFLVHNAGILGDITQPLHQQQDSGPLAAMMTLHVTSMWLLTAKAISIAGARPMFVLNISSLLGSVPMAGLSSYCTTRAARNMLVKTLSLEMKDRVGFRTLTYTPGACDTGMLDAVSQDICFETSKEAFKGMTVLPPSTSIQKLIRIIKDDKFTNGDVIDFYDYKT